MEARTLKERHFVWMGFGFCLLMVVAFTPTYFAPLAAGTFQAAPIFHLHGLMFFAWPVLFLWQALTVARGQMSAHRSFGLLGVALATSMFYTGAAAVAADLRDRQEGAALVAFAGLAMFSLFVILALIQRKQREYHARWMFLATLALMQAVSARFVGRVLGITAPSGLAPIERLQRVGTIHLIFDILVLAIVCAADWRKRGTPHRALLIGGGIIVVVHTLRHSALETSAWRTTADVILAFTS